MSGDGSLGVVVLCGGESPERPVSLKSGEAVAAGLRQAGHRVDLRVLERVRDVLDMRDLKDADVVFPALHGGAGEDGRLQSALDLLGVTYALSGPLAGAVAMDKALTKRLMRGAGIPTPDWLHLSGDPDAGGPADLAARVDRELGWPVVVKPNRDGSSVGVSILDGPEGLDAACDAIRARGDSVLLERFMPGRELTSTILLGRRLPLIEIVPRAGFYDFGNKYTLGACDYLCPAPLDAPLAEAVAADAQRVYDLVGCRGVARVDFRLDGDTYGCLEINTIPGMTATSLVPKAAAAVGIGFAELLSDLCHDALARARA